MNDKLFFIFKNAHFIKIHIIAITWKKSKHFKIIVYKEKRR